jgi:EmrB/QacA subfamily drug resistance transporter
MTSPPADPARAGGVAVGSGAGRWIIAITVAASGMAFLDATVVNVALPAIGDDLDASAGALQWVVSGYLLTLASFILVSGSLSDRLGRRRVLVMGAAVFGAASVGCALAPTAGVLVGARIVQGVGAALLTPGALATIEATIRREDRGRAIGMWSGLTGVTSAIGPAIGGLLISAVSWRAVFLINLPIAAFVIVASRRHLPESREAATTDRIDLPGAALAVVALALGTFALTASTVAPGLRVACAAVALVTFAGFLAVEATTRNPMVPLAMFRVRLFSASNLVTFIVYAATGGFFFLFASFLQIAQGYSPFLAGVAALPITLLMLALSPRSGALATRIGPRWPLTIGPLTIGVGLALLALLDGDSSYLTAVLPPIVIIGVGLVILVAPITTTVLGSVGESQAGIASGINNAVARLGSLIAVAVLPAVAGLSGEQFFDPQAMTDGFRIAMLCCAGLSVVGGVVAAVAIRVPVEPLEEPSTELYSCAASSLPVQTVAALDACSD